MPPALPPLLLAPEDLPTLSATREVLLVDTREPEAWAAGHLPGAVNLPYVAYVREAPPAGAERPHPDALAAVLGRIGYAPERCVVACDEGFSGKAARLLWTLAASGHAGGLSLLDGGLPAALAAGLAVDDAQVHPVAREVGPLADDPSAVVADRDYVLAHLGDPDVLLLDTRSPAEYAGLERRAARGGHIPGAVNLDWMLTFDPRSGRCKPPALLQAQFEAVGATPEREIVVYCQTHHRSAHTWVVLMHLGYTRVRGYAGAWSEWGNTPGLPVEG